MGEVARGGRTVLFVSHNMAAVSKICQRAILLDGGRIVNDGTASTVVESYLNSVSDSNACADLRSVEKCRGNGWLRFTEVWIEGERGQHIHTVRPGQCLALYAMYELHTEPDQISDLNVSFAVRSVWGLGITDLNNRINRHKFGPHIPRKGIIQCVVSRLPLNTGQYHVGIYAEVNGQIADWIQEVFLCRARSLF